MLRATMSALACVTVMTAVVVLLRAVPAEGDTSPERVDDFSYSVPSDQLPALTFRTERLTVDAKPVETVVLRPAERIDRGVVAMPLDHGKVYIGWRLLADDAEDVAFDVQRADKLEGPWATVSGEPVTGSTNFIDTTTREGQTWFYRVALRAADGKLHASKAAKVVTATTARHVIEFDLPEGEGQADRVGIADLDGDGAYDFVVKCPTGKVDPFVWSKSTRTIKLYALTSTGKHLWTHDMGWNIENGIWYSPYVVVDSDADGKADVFVKHNPGEDRRDAQGKVQSGPEFLAKLDGLTGKIVKTTPWHDRSGYLKHPYGNGSRNFLYAAYVNGKTPSVIMQRGNYSTIKLTAFDNDLNVQWSRTHPWSDTTFGHQGAHWVVPGDVDGDGRDELIVGGACYDDNGEGIWSTGMGHPDAAYLADVDPDNAGLEVYLNYEARHEKHGWQLTDARTGRLIWGLDEPNTHIHGEGMVADILPEHPGLECFGRDKKFGPRLLSSKGKRLSTSVLGGYEVSTVRWDSDIHSEVITRDGIVKLSLTGEHKVVGGRPVGRIIAIADILGDWREEIITSSEGKLRIYTTTMPADTRRVCLMQDRLYRNYVTNSTMGYWYAPQLSKAMAD